MKHPRKLRNFLLRPDVQIKIGVYFIGVSIMFALVMGWVFSSQFGSIFETILDLTDIRDEVVEVIDQHIRESMFWLIFISGVFICANIMLAIWYTHRMVGPAVAFKRHIDDLARGNYRAKTSLRSGDAFQDVALRLNSLSEALQARYPEEYADDTEDASA